VQVSRVDLDGRKIDFRLVREGEELAARAMKDKGVANGRTEGTPAKSSTKKRAARKVAAAKDEKKPSLQSAVKAAAAKKAAKAKSPRRAKR
jgi:ribonuclease R